MRNIYLAQIARFDLHSTPAYRMWFRAWRGVWVGVSRSGHVKRHRLACVKGDINQKRVRQASASRSQKAVNTQRRIARDSLFARRFNTPTRDPECRARGAVDLLIRVMQRAQALRPSLRRSTISWQMMTRKSEWYRNNCRATIHFAMGVHTNCAIDEIWKCLAPELATSPIVVFVHPIIR